MKIQSLYDVIIIGAGPAGLTAALYASRARLKTLVVEDPAIISQLCYTDQIENYPGFPEGVNGAALLEKFKKQTENAGAEFVYDGAKGITRSKKEGRDIWRLTIGESLYESIAVIIASGAKPRELGLAGEERFRGNGLSYCAVCDGAFFKDKIIAVIGGGDTAIEEAIFLTRFARKVFIIHRRDRLRATKILQEKVFVNKKIEVIWSSVAEEIIGDKKVGALRIKNVKTDKRTELSCDGVFISVGLAPSTEFVKGIVRLDKDGYIVTDDKMRASQEGIFAAGDCRNTLLRQIVTACGDGASAAFSAQHYIEAIKGTSYI